MGGDDGSHMTEILGKRCVIDVAPDLLAQSIGVCRVELSSDSRWSDR
jgi:hypothetical protein